MYLKYCLILMLILFDFTSCDLIFDEIPLEIIYSCTDKLNMVLSMQHIPRNVVEYKVRGYLAPNHTWEIDSGEVTNEDYERAVLREDALQNANYSVELWNDDGGMCDSRDVVHLIADDYSGREIKKHQCLDKKGCHIKIDFKFSCQNSSLIFKVDKPISFQNSEKNISNNHVNVTVWVCVGMVTAVVIAGGTAILIYKRHQFRNKAADSQEHIYETLPDVLYAEIDAPPCTSDKPNPAQDKEPYAEIIGVLAPKD